MTEQEAIAIYQRIFVVAPDYPEWIAKHSPDPKRTVELWRQMIIPFDLDLVDAIVSELENGQRPMPAAYDRGQFGAVFRSWCAFKKERQNGFARDIGDEYRERTSQRGTGPDPGMKAALEKLNQADDDWNMKKLTYDERCRIKAEAMKRINRNTDRDETFWREKHRDEVPRGFLKREVMA